MPHTAMLNAPSVPAPFQVVKVEVAVVPVVAEFFQSVDSNFVAVVAVVPITKLLPLFQS